MSDLANRAEPGDTVNILGTDLVGTVIETRNIPVWVRVNVPGRPASLDDLWIAPGEYQLISES